MNESLPPMGDDTRRLAMAMIELAEQLTAEAVDEARMVESLGLTIGSALACQMLAQATAKARSGKRILETIKEACRT